MDFNRIRSCGIVPMIKIDEAENALPLANALLEGGIDNIEITFRTAAAKASMLNISKALPEMVVGAGTVINLSQYNEAKAAGAVFVVTPGLNVEVVNAAKADGIAILPGVITPTEIMAGISLGLNVFKFFPAESFGGLNTVKALCGPFGQISFLPTGGISQDNAAEYLKFNKILAVGGSWVAPDKLIAEKNFKEITKRSKEAMEIVKAARL